MATVKRHTAATLQSLDWSALYRETSWERIQRIKRGLPTIWLEATAQALGIPKPRLVQILGIQPRPKNAISNEQLLNTCASERLLGLMRMVGKVQVMVNESGEAAGFNAAVWLGKWLLCPVAALQGRMPAEFLDTSEGQMMVSELLARMQTGGMA